MWKCRERSGERGGSGNSWHRKQLAQDKERKTRPSHTLEPRDPAMPETRPPWTSQSHTDPSSLLLHCKSSQNVVAYTRNSSSSWFCGSMGSAGWFLLEVLHAVVFRYLHAAAHRARSDFLVVWRSHPKCLAFPRVSAPREEAESHNPLPPKPGSVISAPCIGYKGVWRSTQVQGEKPVQGMNSRGA